MYTPALDPKNLHHLVLNDKRAVDAAIQVREFLNKRANGVGVSFRKHEDPWRLAGNLQQKEVRGQSRIGKIIKKFSKLLTK